jgi:O-antigen/teichoic acid export membrane protein
MMGNTLVQMLAQVSGIAVSLLLTPFILSRLGVELFGLWALLGSVVAFAGLLELGLGRGAVRFIASYSERDELDVVRRIVSYGVMTRILLGLLLSPLAWLTAQHLVPHLRISEHLVGTAQAIFPLIFAYSFFSSAVRPLGALLIGLERLWLTSLVTLLSQLVYGVLVVALLLANAGIYGLLVAASIQTALQGVVYYAIGRRLIGRVLANPFRLRRTQISEMVKYGGWLQLNNVASVVMRQTDGIVIGAWVSVATVGLYDIGNRIAQLARSIPLTFLGPLLPAAAGIHARGDDRGIARTLLQGSRLLGLLSIGMGGFVLATAPLIMTVWLGRSYDHVTGIAILLTVAYLINNLTGVGTTIVAAIGRPQIESEYAVIGMALNVAATLLLAPVYGLYGILAGTVFGAVLCSMYFLWRVHRILELSLWEYVGTWIWRLLAATLASAGAVAWLRTIIPPDYLTGRAKGGLVLVGLGVLYVVFILLSLRAVRFLEARDLLVIRRILPGPLRPLARVPAVEFLFSARS